MATLFTKIINGDIPCHKVAEDERYLAFMDINPINPGHVLVVPKQEVDYFFDLDGETLGGIMQFAAPLAKAIEQTVPCKRVGVMIAGLEVPHAHVHLVPITGEGDLTFARAKPADQEELKSLCTQIVSHLNQA